MLPVDATELLQAHARTVMRPDWMQHDTFAGLPSSIIYYVARTKEAVVLATRPSRPLRPSSRSR